MAERLTIRAEEDGIKAVWYGDRDVFLEGEVGYAEADKLAHYEDLEEQGRLIELPCGVGDTVWIIAPNYYKCNNRYNCEDYNPEEYLISWCQKNCSKGYQEIGTIQCVIYGIETYNDENSVQIDCHLDVNGNHYRYSIKDIFLTKEEAEEKLKERGGQE